MFITYRNWYTYYNNKKKYMLIENFN